MLFNLYIFFSSIMGQTQIQLCPYTWIGPNSDMSSHMINILYLYLFVPDMVQVLLCVCFYSIVYASYCVHKLLIYRRFGHVPIYGQCHIRPCPCRGTCLNSILSMYIDMAKYFPIDAHGRVKWDYLCLLL